MESRSFDTLTRRASVLGLGAAGLGTLGVLGAEAKKNKNKNKKSGLLGSTPLLRHSGGV